MPKGFVRDNPFKLSDSQMAFLGEYLVDFNARRAARVAGVNEHQAWNWVKESKAFQSAIDAYLEKRRRENEDLVRDTLVELKAVMCSDIREFVTFDTDTVTLKRSEDLKCSKAIKSVKQTKDGVQITLHDKVRGIELMMTGLGMMKKPGSEASLEAPGSDAKDESGVDLLEALNRAHEERKALPGLVGGMVRIEQAGEVGSPDVQDK